MCIVRCFYPPIKIGGYKMIDVGGASRLTNLVISGVYFLVLGFFLISISIL